MSESTNQRTLPAEVNELLDRIIARVRRLQWIRGAALTVATGAG